MRSSCNFGKIARVLSKLHKPPVILLKLKLLLNATESRGGFYKKIRIKGRFI